MKYPATHQCPRTSGKGFKFLAMTAAAALLSIANAQTDTVKTDDPAGAQNQLEELDRIVITATRTERRLSEMTASVSVIGRDEISAAPAKNVDDLLMSQPGLSVKRVVGMGEGIPGDIIIRGIPGSLAAGRVLILVDGIPTNVSGTPFLIINEVPMEAVERIEIVRGPFSCLYGANAFSGVINIITRRGMKHPGVELHTESWPGSYYNIGLWTGGNTEKTGFTASGGMRGIDNYYLRDSILVREGDSTYYRDDRDNHDYADRRFIGKIDWWISERARLTLQARYFESELGFGKTRKDGKNDPSDTIPGDIVTMGQKIVLGPMFSIAFSDHVDFRVGGYARRLIGEYHNEDISRLVKDTTWGIIPGCVSCGIIVTINDDSTRYTESYWRSVSDDGQLEAQTTMRLGKHHVLVAGIDYLINIIDFGATMDRASDKVLPGSKGREEHISNTGIYLQDEIRPVDALNITPGCRLDYHSLAGWVVSPKIGASLRPDGWISLRCAIGRAFRAPSLTELYMPPLVLQAGRKLVSNENLKPEYVFAVDGGIDIVLSGMIFPTINGFYNRMDDLIAPRISSTPSDIMGTGELVVTHHNIEKAWSAGVEAGLRFVLPRWFSAFGNYAYTESRDIQNNERLDYVPRHKGALGVVFSHAFNNRLKIEATLTEQLVGNRMYRDWQAPERYWDIDSVNLGNSRPVCITLASYARTDLSIKASFFNEHLWAGLNIQNLFNASYEESGGTESVGRFFSIVLGAGF